MVGRRVTFVRDSEHATIERICIERGYGTHFQEFMRVRGVKLLPTASHFGECFNILGKPANSDVEAACQSWQCRP